MSMWTDFRNNVENQVGIGPDSNTAQTLADAALAGGRQVGDLLKQPQSSQPAAPAATAPIAQKVQAFASGNSKTLLLVAAGLAGIFFFMRGRR